MSETVASKSSSPVGDRTTWDTTGAHDASVTKRTWRRPSVSAALCTKTRSSCDASWPKVARKVA
jgi:hypothetical protein